jgi:hypothetical protein
MATVGVGLPILRENVGQVLTRGNTYVLIGVRAECRDLDFHRNETRPRSRMEADA